MKLVLVFWEGDRPIAGAHFLRDSKGKGEEVLE